MANWQSTLIAGASFAILAACGQAKTADTETPSEPEAFAAVDTNRISTASAADEWLTYGPRESLSFYMYQSPRKAKRLYFDVIPKAVDEYHQQLRAFPGQDAAGQVNQNIHHDSRR